MGSWVEIYVRYGILSIGFWISLGTPVFLRVWRNRFQGNTEKLIYLNAGQKMIREGAEDNAPKGFSLCVLSGEIKKMLPVVNRYLGPSEIHKKLEPVLP